LDTLLKNIESLKNEMGSTVVMFRGHSSSTYKLLPTILRCGDATVEEDMFYEYKTYASSLNGKTKSNWDLLLDMQHYGLPTRLLDWTSSLGTALYFALLNNPTSPCIWVLDPYKLSKISTGAGILFDTSTVADQGGHKGFNVSNLIAKESAFETPYAIRPPHGNSRISAQRGIFTVHTKSNKPLEELCPDAVRRVLIPNSEVEKFQCYLQQLGIDEFSLFPDPEGLVGYLKKRYKI